MTKRITLIMPMLNEIRFLPETLASIERQTIGKERMRFVAVDGGSSDGSAEFVEAWLRRSGVAGAVLSNPRRSIPISLNIGARYAGEDDYLVRIDAHTTYGSSYVADVVQAFESDSESLGCVGCAQIPASTAVFERAVVGEFLTHPLGLARIGVRDFDAPRRVETVYLGSWRPGLLHALGGFDEHWRANEDSELEARLRSRGFRLLMVPSENRYHVNRGIRATVQQWGMYGFWRAQTSRRFPHELRARHFIVAGALIAAFIVLWTPWRIVDAFAYAVYAAAVLSLRERAKPFTVALGCCAAFPLFQAAWALGFLRGLLVRPPPFQPAL